MSRRATEPVLMSASEREPTFWTRLNVPCQYEKSCAQGVPRPQWTIDGLLPAFDANLLAVALSHGASPHEPP